MILSEVNDKKKYIYKFQVVKYKLKDLLNLLVNLYLRKGICYLSDICCIWYICLNRNVDLI